jgi:hypothetical protein
MSYTIDKFGFLRRDGKIIGWTPYDFFWARGWFKSPKKKQPERTTE